jgi:hypothetical protein
VFPFFAIITAQYLYHLTTAKSIKAVAITQTVVILLMLVIIGALQYFFRPEVFSWLTALIILALLLMLIFLPGKMASGIQQTVLRTLLAAFVVNVYLNLCFYPSLLKYQSGSEAAIWINNNNPLKLPVYIADGMFHDDMNFYLDAPVTETPPNGSGTLTLPALIYAPPEIVHNFANKGFKYQVIKTFKRYPVTRLKPVFLNKATRDKELGEAQVILLNR